MKKILFTILAMCVCGFFAVQKAQAQKGSKSGMKFRNNMVTGFSGKVNYGKKRQYMTVGGGIGSAHYFGDLAPQTSFASTPLNLTRTMLNVYIQKRMTSRMSVRGGLFWARIMGDDNLVDLETGTDVGRYLRNLHFRNDLIGLNANILFEVFPTNRSYLERPVFSPYFFTGLEVFLSNPMAVAPNNAPSGAGEWVNLRELETEGVSYSAIQMAIPLGFGMDFTVTSRVSLGFDLIYHVAFTDYLDDVSTDYVNSNTFGDKLGESLAFVMHNRTGEGNVLTGGVNARTGERRDKIERGDIVNNTYKGVTIRYQDR